jgi:hypothetical protein
MRHIKCPCGLSDGNDDKIVSHTIEAVSYNGDEVVVLEMRQCDICNKEYEVFMHYRLSYEEMKG